MATLNGIVSAFCDLAKAKLNYSYDTPTDFDKFHAAKLFKMMSGFVLSSNMLLPINSASDVSDGALVEIVVSGKMFYLSIVSLVV